MSNKFMRGAPLLSGDSTVPGVQTSDELTKLIPVIIQKCKDFGLDFHPPIVHMLTYDEISEIAAYDGFPVRYPHWKWGMEYEGLQRGYMHGMHRIYEMVVNTSPLHIYCLASNTLLDNVTVVAHAIGHGDFFKNNYAFQATSQNMNNQLANNGNRVRKYRSRWGKEEVTKFLDHVLRIQTLIDPAKIYEQKKPREVSYMDHREYRHPDRIPTNHDYMEPFVNPDKWIKRQQKAIEKEELARQMDIFLQPTKDIMGFIRDHAPLKHWQQDIVSMLYEESLYFSPQRATKTCNEGHACQKRDSLVYTDLGLIKIGDIVDNKLNVNVYDGESFRQVTNWFEFKNKKTVKITTNRGYEIDGSTTHRIIDGGGEWKNLGSIKVGDKVKICSSNIWAKDVYKIDWELKRRKSHSEFCREIGISESMFKYRNCDKKNRNGKLDEIDEKIKEYNDKNKEFGTKLTSYRKKISIPTEVNEEFASFLGYLIGDGHISEIGRELGLTTGDEEQADNFIRITKNLFGLECRKRWDGSSKNGRWRVSLHSRTLMDFLKYLGLKTGNCARQKFIPDCILQSPKNVVSAFIRSYLDCDGYAGESGVILSTSSTKMANQLQLLLLNYGILSSKSAQQKEIWNVNVRGKFAEIYYKEIGFGLMRKQNRLHSYVYDRKWFVKENWVDEVVHIEYGEDDVYDITVDETHKFVGQGFMNHNSWTDHHIMCTEGFCGLGQKSDDCGIFEYATHKMGVLGGKYSMNPYKLGFTLLLDIEDRWNKGKFGQEWEDCTDMRERELWDKKLNLGHDKVLEVRKCYNDVTLISEFFTDEFCRKHQFFEWEHLPNGDTVIKSDDPKAIKKKLIQRYMNGGLPDIHLTDPNFKGKGYMLLEHKWDGRILYENYVEPVLQSLYALWQNDIFLATRDKDGNEVIYECYGSTGESVSLRTRKEVESEK